MDTSTKLSNNHILFTELAAGWLDWKRATLKDSSIV